MKIINRLTSNWYAILCLVLCTATMYSSCSKEDDEEGLVQEIQGSEEVTPEKDVPDPTGTIALSMRDYNNGNTILGDAIVIDNENFTDKNNWPPCNFASVGSVKGLGNVTSIPTTGWASQVAVKPGNGYVAYDIIRTKFYRIYVNNFIVDTTGGIIGAEVKYQAPFKGKDETIALDVQSLTIPAAGGEQTLIFKNHGVILFDVKSEKFTTAKASTYEYPFLTNGIAIKAKPNKSIEVIQSTVTLTTLYGKETYINVTQAGAEPFLSLDKTELELSASQQDKTIGMHGNIAFNDLSASSSASWCKAELIDNTSTIQTQSKKVQFVGNVAVNKNRATQSDGVKSYALKLSLGENNTDHPRNATITVSSKNGEASTTLNVVQEGILFEVENDIIRFNKNVNYRTISIYTSANTWEAESSADWCTLSKNGNQITIRTTASTVDRTAYITFKGLETKITIHQSKYEVGDSFNENGIVGTVGYIGDKGRYIYKDMGSAPWSSEYVETGANSMDDGEYNMAVIKKIPFWEDIYLSFQLCEQLNTNGVTGWFLPAINELSLLSLSDKYWSSTEYGSSNAYYRQSSKQIHLKNNRNKILAVHKF